MRTLGRAVRLAVLLAGLVPASPSGAQVVAWTARYNAGFQAGSIRGGRHSLAVDATGNVYVAGWVKESSTVPQMSWRTTKYAPDGSVLWTARHEDSLGYGSAVPVALALDGAGHVYVAGSSTLGERQDFWTVKYSAADGSEIWSVGHDTPWRGAETVRDLALGPQGDVYVTGTTEAGGDTDFYTVKQSAADGRLLWAARYDGLSGDLGVDDPIAIAVDAAGNAYVAGTSRSLVNDDVRTIKYASSDGQVLWSVAFDSGSADKALGLGLDPQGNASVTADKRILRYASQGGAVLWSVAPPFVPSAAAVDALGDLLVLGGGACRVAKLAAAGGALLWNVSYASPSSTVLALDGPGDVYVAGTSAGPGGQDFNTLRLSGTDGSVAWSAWATSPGNASDAPVAIAVGVAGDVAVSGTSGPAGSPTGDVDLLTARHGSDGGLGFAVLEQALLGTEDRPGIGPATAVDAAGNTYVTGRANVDGDEDWATVKLGPDGTLLWSARYAGLPDSDDVPRALALDGAGNVYVTGSSSGATSPTSRDFRTIKYAGADGSVLWSVAFDGAFHGSDNAYALVVDAAGDAYVAGSSQDSSTGSELRVVKYASADGSVVWSTYDSDSSPKRMALDGSGGLYVLGAGVGKLATSGGGWLWSRNAGGVTTALALDPSGNPVVTGSSTGSPANLRTYKLASSDGHLLWDATLAEPVSSSGRAIAVDAAGDVFVTGSRSAGSLDVLTVKHAGGDGSILWAVGYDAPAHAQDEAYVLALDGAGSVYVAGRSFNGLNSDYRTLKYAGTDGALTWSAAYAGPGLGSDFAQGLAVDAAGRAHVTGYSYAAGTGTDFLTIVYGKGAASADLSVSVSDGRPTSTPGGPAVYSVMVRNTGPADVTGASLQVPFPGACATVTWSCFSFTRATCSAAGSGSISDTVGLPAGSFAVYTAECAIDAGARGTLAVTATLAGSVSDPDPANNVATDTDTLTPAADLALGLTDSPDPAPVFGSVTYVLDYANRGPSLATGASVQLQLPPGLGFVSATTACGHANGLVTCAPGAVAPGGGGAFTVLARAQPGAIGAVAASASLVAAEDDPYLPDNTAAASTQLKFLKGDLQNDLATDLYLAHPATGENRAWLMNGVSRAAETPFDPATASSPTQQLAGVDDFDGDHRNDLVFWDAASGAVEFWLMNGATRLGAPVPLSGAPVLATNWRLSATADFDHDRRPDVVWRNVTSQKIVVWTMNGTAKAGNIVPDPPQAADPNWEIAGAFDLDGDGNTDLLWYNWSSGRIVYWLMDASVRRLAGSFANPPAAADASWKVLAAGDFGPGPGGLPDTVDLVWRNAVSGRYVVWYMDRGGNRTAGTFTTPMEPEADPLGWTIAGPR